jgi:nucleotide-binding universal stress UspA family protein
VSVIAHTTDLSGDDTAAFVHAAAFAAASGGRLITLHGNPGPADASRLPDAAVLAARWGRPIEQQRICHECCEDVADTLLDALRGFTFELVVTGTHGRHGLSSLVHASVAEALARNLTVPTLVVPNLGRGFVDAATGTIALRRVLVPVGDAAEEARGRAAVHALTELAGSDAIEIITFHAHAAAPARAILEEALSRDVDAIVMSTHGHDGIGDVLFGSRTEHVIRGAACPVLSVPMR